MQRQEKKRIARMATDIFLQERNLTNPNSSRRERREAAAALLKRVVKESPPETFVRHSAMKPSASVIISPDVKVEVDGVDPKKEQKRSASGRIIVLE